MIFDYIITHPNQFVKCFLPFKVRNDKNNYYDQNHNNIDPDRNNKREKNHNPRPSYFTTKFQNHENH